MDRTYYDYAEPHQPDEADGDDLINAQSEHPEPRDREEHEKEVREREETSDLNSYTH